MAIVVSADGNSIIPAFDAEKPKPTCIINGNHLCFQFYAKRHTANVLYFTNNILWCFYIDTNDGDERLFVSRFKRRSGKWRKQFAGNNAAIINKFRIAALVLAFYKDKMDFYHGDLVTAFHLTLITLAVLTALSSLTFTKLKKGDGRKCQGSQKAQHYVEFFYR